MVTVVGWLWTLYLVAEANGLVTPTVTWHWSPPTKTTAYFAWEIDQVTSGGVSRLKSIASGDSDRLTVTLPRGFRTGQLRVVTTASSDLYVSAEAMNNKKIQSRQTGRSHTLDFSWGDLLARGHRFTFVIEIPPGQGPAEIRSVAVEGTR